MSICNFGLTVSYDMGWQRRSSGNNYTSLSGHAFLIGGHTRRVIACVVFSKKCSICTKRGQPKTSSIIASSSSPSPPTTVNPPPQSPTTPATITTPANTILISTIEPTLPAYDVEDLGKEGTDEEDTTGGAAIIDTSTIDHECTRNYDGSSGGMESDGLLLLMLKLDNEHDGEIFLEYVVTDDDTKMRSYIAHHKTKPRGKKILVAVYHHTYLCRISTPTLLTEKNVSQDLSSTSRKDLNRRPGRINWMHSE